MLLGMLGISHHGFLARIVSGKRGFGLETCLGFRQSIWTAGMRLGFESVHPP